MLARLIQNAQALHQGVGATAHRFAIPPTLQQRRQFDVGLNRQVVDQVEELEDEADVGAAEFRQRRLVHLAEDDALDLDPPGGGAIQATHQVQQRGFAAPRRPHHRHETPVGNVQRDTPQRRKRDGAGFVDLLHVYNFDQGGYASV